MAKYDFKTKLKELMAAPSVQKANGFVRACKTSPLIARKAITEWWSDAVWTEEQKFSVSFPVLEIFRRTGELPEPATKKAA